MGGAMTGALRGSATDRLAASASAKKLACTNEKKASHIAGCETPYRRGIQDPGVNFADDVSEVD